MTPSLHTVESEIARERADLDAWLAESYAGREDQRYYGENDASYDAWGRIESVVGRVFDAGLTQRLSQKSVGSVLFFISRSDELGRIIAWLAPTTGSPFSWCGDLFLSRFPVSLRTGTRSAGRLLRLSACHMLPKVRIRW